MELIYLYINKFGENIKNQGINFSPNFNVKIENNRLIVDDLRDKNRAHFQSIIYSKNIKNITLLLGKNGSGKTTILNLLGMNRKDRINKSIIDGDIKDEYFLLYHIDKNRYAMEFLYEYELENSSLIQMPSFIKDIKNISAKSNRFFYKPCIGIVLDENRGNFEVSSNLFDLNEFNGKECDNIEFNYLLNSSNEIVKRRGWGISTNDNDSNYGYLYRRKYKIEPTKVGLYKSLAEIMNKDYLNFTSKKAFIEVSVDIKYNIQIFDQGDIEYLEDWIRNLEELLEIYKKPLVIMSKEVIDDNFKNISNKDIYLNDIISKYILNIFVSAICTEFYKGYIKSDGISLDDINYKDLLNELKKDENKQYDSTEFLGDIVNLEVEYNNLIKVISYYYEDKSISNYNKLIYISRYVYSRIHKEINDNRIESEYQISMEEMFDKIRILKEKYFHRDSLIIKCTSECDKNVEEFLRTYDKYNSYKYCGYNADKGSDVSHKFKFNITALSEGEYKLVELISRILEIIKSSEDKKLIVILLDEPDQSLHPEWSRQFIKVICEGVKEYKNKNIQFILSTHSPFMVSDILSDNVYCLENTYIDNKNNVTITNMAKNKELYNSFGANIYDILKDSFILNKTIGEYAYEKISYFIRDIQDNGNNLDEEYVEFFINSIGENFLRKKLKNMYRKKRNSEKDMLINEINLLKDDEKLRKIKSILNGE